MDRNKEVSELVDDIGYPSQILGGEDPFFDMPSYQEIEFRAKLANYFISMGKAGYEAHRTYLKELRDAFHKVRPIPSDFPAFCACPECLELSVHLDRELSRKNGIFGWIYMMENKRNTYIKIGYTKHNPSFREKTLQSEEPEIVLIMKHCGSRRTESSIHSEYSHRRLRGEWFDLTKIDFVTICEKYFGYRGFISDFIANASESDYGLRWNERLRKS